MTTIETTMGFQKIQEIQQALSKLCMQATGPESIDGNFIICGKEDPTTMEQMKPFNYICILHALWAQQQGKNNPETIYNCPANLSNEDILEIATNINAKF